MKTHNTLYALLALAVVLIGGAFVYSKIYSPLPSSKEVSTEVQTKTHTSEDLKLSFQYPKDWHVDDRYQKILLSNYQTSLNQNNQPQLGEIAITFKHASLCQKTLDEDVLLGGCGEGKNSKNEILSKTTKQVSAGSFITYAIRYPSGQGDTFYYLQQGDTILQISKQPDPSQFEKEFEAIINSIEFL